MNIEDLTIGQAKELLALFHQETGQKHDPYPWKLGQAYHIRTVTHYWTGKLVGITNQELVLADAAWIADTGRFSDMFQEGASEVEPVAGYVIIGRGAIVDAQEWSIALPRSQK